MIQRYSSLKGIRDENALRSALSSAYTGFSNGEEAYPNLIDKISVVSFKLIANHPFVDGNKRVGAYVFLSLLKRYGFMTSFSKKDLEDTILKVAAGDIDFERFRDWAVAHVEKILHE